VLLSGRLDKNWLNSLSNTMIKDLQTTCSNGSTIGCSQSIPSTQTPEFEVILDKSVQARTTHLAGNYERFTVETVELC